MGFLAGSVVRLHALIKKYLGKFQSWQLFDCGSTSQPPTSKVKKKKFLNRGFLIDFAMLTVVAVGNITFIHKTDGQLQELISVGSKGALNKMISWNSDHPETCDYALHILAIVLVWKIFFTCVALSMPVPTGCVGPTLVIGAFGGKIFSHFVPKAVIEWMDPTESVGSFGAKMAIVGATTFTGGFCRTLSIVITVFELLTVKELILPLSLATLCSCSCAELIAPSFLDSLLKMKKLPALPTLLATRKALQEIKSVMTPVKTVVDYALWRKQSCMDVGLTLDKLERMGDEAPNLIPILEEATSVQDDDGKTYIMVGGILNHNLSKVHAELTHLGDAVQDILALAVSLKVSSTPLIVDPDLTVQDAYLQCQAQNYQHTIMIVEHGLFEGLLTQKRLLDFGS